MQMKWNVVILPMLSALSGCALLEQPDDGSGGPSMTMTADIVPLVASEQRYERGEPMSVPEEPPPFPIVKGRYVGMQSDLEAARHAVKAADDELHRIPREPIP